MRATITLIHVEHGEVVSSIRLQTDYKPSKQTSFNGNDVIEYSQMMFLLPFGVYTASQGDYIVVGNVNVTTNTLTETLKNYDYFEIKSVDEVENKYGVNYKYKVMAQ